MHKVAFIIIHWNTPDLLYRLVNSLQHYPDSQIIIVDNHSEKFPADPKKLNVKNIQLISNPQNYGFAKAGNLGAAQADAEWLFFLNPDVSFEKISDIDDLITQARQNNWDAVSPLPDAKQLEKYAQFLPSVYNVSVMYTPLRRVLPTLGRYKTLTGGVLLIKNETFRRIGTWDESFFMWFEDSDLTNRLIKSGYKVGWSSVAVKHQGGQTVKLLTQNEQKKLFFASMNVYAQKYFGLIGQIIVKAIVKWNLVKK